MKLELLDGENVVKEAIRFIESRKEEIDERLSSLQYQEAISPFPEEDGNAQF
jgi:hypothetical protein